MTASNGSVQPVSIDDLIKRSGVDPRDVKDIVDSLAEIVARTGWGRIEIHLEAGEVSEMIISHKRKPKVERRANKV